MASGEHVGFVVRLEILPAGETENAKLHLQRRLEGGKTWKRRCEKRWKFWVPRISPRINMDQWELMASKNASINMLETCYIEFVSCLF